MLTPTTPNFNCNSPPFLIKVKRRALKMTLSWLRKSHKLFRPSSFVSFATLNEIRTTILNAPPDCRLMSSGHRGASAIEVYIFIYNRVCSSLKVYIMSTIRSLYVDNHQSTDQYVRLIGTQYPVSLHTV